MFLTTDFFFIFFYLFITILYLYWRYIKAFIKVLTIYHR
jgi:hypothetical protein